MIKPYENIFLYLELYIPEPDILIFKKSYDWDNIIKNLLSAYD